MDLDEIFIKCPKWDKEQNVKISMLMVGFQSQGIILWSRHSIRGLSCLGRGLRSLIALFNLYEVMNINNINFMIYLTFPALKISQISNRMLCVLISLIIIAVSI